MYTYYLRPVLVGHEATLTGEAAEEAARCDIAAAPAAAALPCAPSSHCRCCHVTSKSEQRVSDEAAGSRSMNSLLHSCPVADDWRPFLSPYPFFPCPAWHPP